VKRCESYFFFFVSISLSLSDEISPFFLSLFFSYRVKLQCIDWTRCIRGSFKSTRVSIRIILSCRFETFLSISVMSSPPPPPDDDYVELLATLRREGRRDTGITHGPAIFPMFMFKDHA
jgi:hypothetical protein